MAIKFNCPHCSQPLEAPEDMRGEYIPCPKCERLISIPKAVQAPLEPITPAIRTEVILNQAAPAKTSGMAIASMVVGIVGIVGGWMCCGIILPILAIILGHISFAQIQRTPDRLTGKGLAIAGFTTGYVGLILGIIISLLLGTLGASMTAILSEFNKIFEGVVPSP